MSSGISPVAGQRLASQVEAAAAAHDPRMAKLKSAATEFESLLVKQLLKSAKLGGSGSGGDEKSNGYADMSVDALASAVERGGGLGLARQIEHAIGGAAGHGALAQPLPATPKSGG